jgi:hypothetical protein
MNNAVVMVMTVSAACLGGCFSWSSGSDASASRVAARASGTTNPFAPVAIRVHPLTRVVSDKEGRPEIVLHLECRDAWGDSAKALGAVMVRLVSAGSADVGGGGGGAAALESGATRWDIDLSNLETNASMFDPATRTYRMQLTGVPTSVGGPGGVGGAGGAARKIVLQATLTPPGGDGVMSDEFEVRR